MALGVTLHRRDWLVLAGGLVALIALAAELYLEGVHAGRLCHIDEDAAHDPTVRVFVRGKEDRDDKKGPYYYENPDDLRLAIVKQHAFARQDEIFVPVLPVERIARPGKGDSRLVFAYGKLELDGGGADSTSGGQRPKKASKYVLSSLLGGGDRKVELQNLTQQAIDTGKIPLVFGFLEEGGNVLYVHEGPYKGPPPIYLARRGQPPLDPGISISWLGVKIKTEKASYLIGGVAQPLLAVFLIYWLLVSVVVVRRLRVQKGDAWPILRLPKLLLRRRPGLRWFDGYRLLEELGDSSEKATMVFRARREEDGRNYVLKILKPQYVKKPTIREGFLEEAKRLRSLSHPFIVRALDVGQGSLDDLGTVVPFFVMNVARGRSLRLGIRKGLSRKVALEVIMECCAALREPHAHQTSHNDIKPENIFVELDSRRQSLSWLQLLDFGISTDKEDETTGRVRGTPSYLSPEQARGQHPDARSDIFVLGLVLCEMISGKQVFPVTTSVADTIRTIASEDEVQIDDRLFGSELGQILRRMLRKNRDDRFQSVTELRGDLEHYYKSPYGVYMGLQAVR